jgi:hypothetical protein
MEQIVQRTPWGKTQYSTVLAPGIVFYSTAGHGGIRIDKIHQREMMKYKGIGNFLGSLIWWEEDCDWSIPYYIFRDEIKIHETEKNFDSRLNAAINTIKQWKPEFAKIEGLE